jgi:hypothetical protein
MIYERGIKEAKFKASAAKEKRTSFFLDSWPFNMGSIGCSKTSLRNYHYMMLKRSQF